MPRSKISRSAAFGIRKSYIYGRWITDISPVFFVLDTEGVFIVTFSKKIISLSHAFVGTCLTKYKIIQNGYIYFEEKFY